MIEPIDWRIRARELIQKSGGSGLLLENAALQLGDEMSDERAADIQHWAEGQAIIEQDKDDSDESYIAGLDAVAGYAEKTTCALTRPMAMEEALVKIISLPPSVVAKDPSIFERIALRGLREVRHP